MKKIFGFIIAILVIFCIVFLINKPTTHNNIVGTYRNQDNSFNTISFDINTNEYIENIFNTTTHKTIKNSGNFSQKKGTIKFISGKYVNYQVKFENKILILFSTDDVVKFDKIDDAPIIINP